jgi:hypothetical protein
MDYLRNHCWCSESNWGSNYNCQIIVSLNSYAEEYKEDWDNLIDRKSEFITESPVPDEPRFNYQKPVINLKPHVLNWLESNVSDLSVDKFGNNTLKAWCIGSTQYRSINSSGFSVFFQRRKDAMAFIKQFSKYKKPIYYTQYFTDVRKVLDLNTMKYKSR